MREKKKKSKDFETKFWTFFYNESDKWKVYYDDKELQIVEYNLAATHNVFILACSSSLEKHIRSLKNETK